MKLVFVSNYINHHQIPLCEELYRLSGGDFVFVQTEPMSEERTAMGWDASLADASYIKNRWDDEKGTDRLIFESDCVIFGGAEDEELVIKRLEAGKFTLRYNERLYKTGRWKFISPKGLKKKYHDHIRFKQYPVYFLCAGAYVAGDFKLIGAYPDKMLKFGYFPKVYEYVDVHFKRKERNDKDLSILWAGRFIDWKHPEMMIKLAEILKQDNIAFKIDMIGSGELLEQTKADAERSGVSDLVSFTGALSPDEVREKMLESDIFISTSDRMEGWGAVINEAMNSGCVTFAAKEIGAAPYLIDNGVNGFMYRACNVKELAGKVEELSDKKDIRYEIGTKAYETMESTWNAKVAAERLWAFINDKDHKMPDYETGPVSKA